MTPSVKMLNQMRCSTGCSNKHRLEKMAERKPAMRTWTMMEPKDDKTLSLAKITLNPIINMLNYQGTSLIKVF